MNMTVDRRVYVDALAMELKRSKCMDSFLRTLLV
jgi:hypothetical protein